MAVEDSEKSLLGPEAERTRPPLSCVKAPQQVQGSGRRHPNKALASGRSLRSEIFIRYGFGIIVNQLLLVFPIYRALSISNFWDC